MEKSVHTTLSLAKVDDTMKKSMMILCVMLVVFGVVGISGIENAAVLNFDEIKSSPGLSVISHDYGGLQRVIGSTAFRISNITSILDNPAYEYSVLNISIEGFSGDSLL